MHERNRKANEGSTSSDASGTIQNVIKLKWPSPTAQKLPITARSKENLLSEAIIGSGLISNGTEAGFFGETKAFVCFSVARISLLVSRGDHANGL